MCKVSGTIEEKTWEELKKLRLLETAEPIPLLEDVLHLVQGKVPILIEVKLLTEDMEICRCLARRWKITRERSWFSHLTAWTAVDEKESKQILR